MNREWHANHRLARNASTAERIAWHIEHARECACRPVPDGLRRFVDADDMNTSGPGAEGGGPGGDQQD